MSGFLKPVASFFQAFIEVWKRLDFFFNDQPKSAMLLSGQKVPLKIDIGTQCFKTL